MFLITPISTLNCTAYFYYNIPRLIQDLSRNYTQLSH